MTHLDSSARAPVPIDAARDLAIRHKQNAVAIFSIDEFATHVVTWGNSAEAKDRAAKAGDAIIAMLQKDGGRFVRNADYRTRDAAAQALLVDKLVGGLQYAEEAIAELIADRYTITQDQLRRVREEIALARSFA